MNRDLQKVEICKLLLAGKQFHHDVMEEAHYELVNGGFANYSSGTMYKNWKTDCWRPTPAVPYVEPERIESRFEIMDL